MVSYVCRPRKCVYTSEFVHHKIQFDADTIEKKPEIIKVYNATKSGVDTMDQLVGTYSVRRKTNRWPMAFFYDMLDICGLNAYVIWTELNPEWNKSTSRRRCEFLKELGKELVKPFVESTRSKIPGLSHASKRTIKEMMASPTLQDTSISKSNPSSAKKGKRKRCVHCTSYRQSWLVCSSCVQNVCGEHSEKSTTVLCKACF
ncbi:hypothetical protein BV898_14903 [Hypsibius exemplaris]|uniref:PiggyBac transposable element-derived protein domain-containing protein n=1 Tax=Hypsibius exemplaris TaxID=2072580 RepID=A0A9X6NBI8_HYPEX|nr:hypothetical protein BV898_14903 [Hypsibius exemplaris]